MPHPVQDLGPGLARAMVEKDRLSIEFCRRHFRHSGGLNVPERVFKCDQGFGKKAVSRGEAFDFPARPFPQTWRRLSLQGLLGVCRLYGSKKANWPKPTETRSNRAIKCCSRIACFDRAKGKSSREIQNFYSPPEPEMRGPLLAAPLEAPFAHWRNFALGTP
jgi:hypothetical protein